MVVANGDILTASETENSDLFWGIRGGGCNFGVIAEFRMRLHRQRPTIYSFSESSVPQTDVASRAIEETTPIVKPEESGEIKLPGEEQKVEESAVVKESSKFIETYPRTQPRTDHPRISVVLHRISMRFVISSTYRCPAVVAKKPHLLIFHTCRDTL